MMRSLKLGVLAAAMTLTLQMAGHAPAGAANPPTDLMWHNPSTGVVSTWVLNGYGNVLSQRDLDWRCDIASGCAYAWHPVSVADFNGDGGQDLLWHNLDTGELSAWLINATGTVVLGKQTLSWSCALSSGCAGAWVTVDAADLNNDGKPDLVWYNPTTGQVSTWLLNGSGTVIGTQWLDWTCDYASTCAYSWYPVRAGDLDNDGKQDLVWFNHTTGQVSTWLLNGNGVVLGTQALDWTCAGECYAQGWRPSGVGDLNGDGRQDLTWYNANTGVVSTWLLNGAGVVLGKQDVDWRCDYASGCAYDWNTVDLVD
jgi:hypothetical protein